MLHFVQDSSPDVTGEAENERDKHMFRLTYQQMIELFCRIIRIGGIG